MAFPGVCRQHGTCVCVWCHHLDKRGVMVCLGELHPGLRSRLVYLCLAWPKVIDQN